jgi:hypothetical protein
MNSKALGEPLAFMSFPERRRWRQVERRAVREHNAKQLTTLRILAATGGALTSLIYPDSGRYATSVEFMIAGTRIRAGRVHRPTLSALTQALGCMPTVALLTASRYGPYWVLTFELATAPLVVLVDKLSILPDRHGGSTPLAAPTAPGWPSAGSRRLDEIGSIQSAGCQRRNVVPWSSTQAASSPYGWRAGSFAWPPAARTRSTAAVMSSTR